jgi:hypothetical protein
VRDPKAQNTVIIDQRPNCRPIQMSHLRSSLCRLDLYSYGNIANTAASFCQATVAPSGNTRVQARSSGNGTVNMSGYQVRLKYTLIHGCPPVDLTLNSIPPAMETITKRPPTLSHHRCRSTLRLRSMSITHSTGAIRHTLTKLPPKPSIRLPLASLPVTWATRR